MSESYMCRCYEMYLTAEDAAACCGYAPIPSRKRLAPLRGALLLSGTRARGAVFDDTQALHVVYDVPSRTLSIQRGANVVRAELEGRQGRMLWVDGVIADVSLTPLREKDWVVFVVEISFSREEAAALPTPRALTTRV